MIETWNACFAIYNMLAVALLADDTGAGLTGPDLLVWHALDTGQDQGSGSVVGNALDTTSQDCSLYRRLFDTGNLPCLLQTQHRCKSLGKSPCHP